MKTSMLPTHPRSFLSCLAAFVIVTASALASFASDGYNWQAMNSGTTRALHQISVVDNNFAVAAGTHGTLLVYSDGAWSPMPGWTGSSAAAPMTDTWPLYVTAVSRTNVWIGAYGSALNQLVRWNGTDFTSSTVTGARTRYLANVDGILLAARGENYVSISSNPVATTPTFRNVRMPFGTSGQVILSVGGSSDGNLWAMSGVETFRSTDAGFSWTNLGRPADIQAGELLQALAVTSSETTWLGTNTGRLFAWSKDSSPQGGSFGTAVLDLDFHIRDIYARDDQNIWIVGDGGNLWYYNGTTSSRIDLGTAQTLYSVTGNEHGIWVTGAGGVIYSTIPEPSTTAIAVMGACCFAGYRFWRQW